MRIVWKDIDDFKGFYQVSNTGQVRSLPRVISYIDGRKAKIPGKLLALNTHRNRYVSVSMYNGRYTKRKYVHRLVYEAFKGTIPKGLVVDHQDRDRRNNTINNLRVISYSHNVKNTDTSTHSSQYNGVTWRKNRRVWVTSIWFNGRSIKIGYNKSEKDAAKCFNDFCDAHALHDRKRNII